MHWWFPVLFILALSFQLSALSLPCYKKFFSPGYPFLVSFPGSPSSPSPLLTVLKDSICFPLLFSVYTFSLGEFLKKLYSHKMHIQAAPSFWGQHFLFQIITSLAWNNKMHIQYNLPIQSVLFSVFCCTFRIFTDMYNYHHCQFLGIFITSKRNSITFGHHLLFSPLLQLSNN